MQALPAFPDLDRRWVSRVPADPYLRFDTCDYSLDPPPDAGVRPDLDYELLRQATVGERELFYVYDRANARIIAYQRADGAFVKQWMAPRSGAYATLLDDITGFQVQSAADGPPAAYLLSGGRVIRVVLE